MSTLKPADTLPELGTATAYDRLRFCASMLYVHDFLTNRERELVHTRMQKWRRKHAEPRGASNGD